MREVYGACSLDCPDAYAWAVTVDDNGQAMKLRGRMDHPYTRRQLCRKINPRLSYATSPAPSNWPPPSCRWPKEPG